MTARQVDKFDFQAGTVCFFVGVSLLAMASAH